MDADHELVSDSVCPCRLCDDQGTALGVNVELTVDELLIAARYDNGESTIALSRDTGISRYEINRILGAAGVKRRRSHTIATLPESTRKWIARLYEAGLPAVRIGSELGLETSLVSAVLNLEGVRRRPHGGRMDDVREDSRPDDTESQTSAQPAEEPYIDPREEEPEPSMDASTVQARRTAYLIVAAYLEGQSLDAISERFGYPAWRIVRILKSANVTLLAETRPRPVIDSAPDGPGDHPATDSHLPTGDGEKDADDWRKVVEAHYADQARGRG